MGHVVHAFELTSCRDRLGLGSTELRSVRDTDHLVPSHGSCLMWSMHDAAHPSRMMMIRIVLYKGCFNVYVTNTADITIRIVLYRMDVSGQDCRIHASF